MSEEITVALEAALAEIAEATFVAKSEIEAVAEEVIAEIESLSPVEETPVEEVPVEETPVEEVPVEEVPVEEVPSGPTDEEVALWVKVVNEIAERDAISTDEANTNLINLLTSLKA